MYIVTPILESPAPSHSAIDPNIAIYCNIRPALLVVCYNRLTIRTLLGEE